MYYYHRPSRTRLPGLPGSPEFLLAIQGLSSKASQPLTTGTLGALIEAYRASPDFADLAPRSRAIYQDVFDYLRPLTHVALASFTSDRLYELRDRTFKLRKRAFANLTIKLLRTVFNWGMKRRQCDTNPALAVDLVAKPRNAPVVNRPWTPEELETVLAQAPGPIRVAVALAAYTGLRESDVALVTWACYDGTAFEVRQVKTGNSVWIPAHSRLRAILDELPHQSPQIVVSSAGRPYAPRTLSSRFWTFMAELRDAGKVGPGLSFHGLRHTLGTALAEAGCDPATIASILGHKTTAMAEHYSRHANRRRLASAAIAKLERPQN